MLLIKLGGGLDLNWEGFGRDVQELQKENKVIIIHGASATRDRLADRIGIPVRTVESPSGVSSVYTDHEAMDIFLMAYPGLINKKLVALLQGCGVNAVGLSGLDGGLWRATAKKEILIKEGHKIKLLRNNLSGSVKDINTSLLHLLIENGYVPVICPPALGNGGKILNTDNDLAAAVVVKQLQIRRFVSLFEAPGLLADPTDESTLISSISAAEIEGYIQQVRGRMKKKVLGAKRALDAGVRTIYWGDGRKDSPVLSALRGEGTVIKHQSIKNREADYD